MKKSINAEVHVLDRLMYLLEERSVSRLAGQDETFAAYIHGLYDSLSDRSAALQGKQPA